MNLTIRFSCTAFETSNPSKSGKTVQCFLFGHANVQAAAGVDGTCFKMAAVKKASPKVSAAAVSLANTVDLGEGLCRGYNWADGVNWPKDKGHRTPKECLAACKQTAGCSAFDLSQPTGKSGKKVQCFLYGHTDVRPASGLEGRCLKMTEVKTASGEASGLHLAPNEVRVGDAAIARKLEHGSCRGAGWQAGIWPVEAGVMTRKECAEACIRTEGCKAFDVRKPDTEFGHHHDFDPKDFECTLYGHKNVEPASGVPADCYTIALLDPSQVPKKPKKVAKPAPAKQAAAKPAGKAAVKKEPKIPVFDPPTVLEDDDDVTDEGFLFEPPPPEVRSRKHIETILHLVSL